MTTATTAILSFLLGWFLHTFWIKLVFRVFAKNNPKFKEYANEYIKEKWGN